MEIEAAGAEEAAERLDEQADRAADLRPLLSVLASELQAMTDAAFATDTGPDGVPWAPRAAAVRVSNGRPARARTETRPGRGLLEDTGELRASISFSVVGGSIVGEASSPHAGYVQRGTRHAPARPFIPSADMTTGPAAEWFDSLADRVAEYIMRGSV